MEGVMEKWTVQDALGSLEQEAQLTKGRKQEEEEEDELWLKQEESRALIGERIHKH